MATAKKTITVVQTGSLRQKPRYARRPSLVSALGRIGWTRDLEDTPAVRGMVARVKHLVKIEEKKGK